MLSNCEVTNTHAHTHTHTYTHTCTDHASIPLRNNNHTPASTSSSVSVRTNSSQGHLRAFGFQLSIFSNPSEMSKETMSKRPNKCEICNKLFEIEFLLISSQYSISVHDPCSTGCAREKRLADSQTQTLPETQDTLDTNPSTPQTLRRSYVLPRQCLVS